MSLSGSSAAALASGEEDTPAPGRQVNPSFSPFASLPDTQVEEILQFLSFSECRQFLGLSQNLWKLKNHMQGNMQHLTLTRKEGQRLLMMTHIVQSPQTLYQQVFGQMTLLQSLNMHWCCTDEFLRLAFGQSGTILFPNLQHLKMRCSRGVTNTGLGFLGDGHRSTGRAIAASLETIDIAFCVNTTYEGTLALRNSNRLPNLRVIRRQPEWMDGHFETPFFGHDEARREVHTYYADGSFQFINRDVLSHGFVCQLIPQWGKQHDGDQDEDVTEIENDDDSFSFLEATIQYNNFGARRAADLPGWAQRRFRPCFCLLRLPPSTSLPRPEDQHDLSHSESAATSTRTLLVAQFTHSIQTPPPPEIRLLMERIAQEEESVVPVGESRYFDKTTKELIPNYRTDFNEVVHGDAIMISRIQVRPFASRQDDDGVSEGDVDGTMPPQSLVHACRNTTQQDRLFQEGGD